MKDNQEMAAQVGGNVNLGRHMSQCSICRSPYREQIEECWVDWGCPSQIALQYDISRDSLYRHAHALGLFDKRRRNITIALEKIIERGASVSSVSASAVVSAIQACVKLNGAAQAIEQAEATNPKKLLERMSQQEREAFARDGSLPDWFSKAIGATPSDGQETEKESQVTETERVQ